MRLSDKRLGKPPKNPEINAVHKQLLSADQRKRNELEGVFGTAKRKYAFKLIIARLAKGAETSISMAFLVMCAEKIRRLLRFFFVVISAWFMPGNGLTASEWSLGAFGYLRYVNHLSLDNRAFELPHSWCMAAIEPVPISLFRSPYLRRKLSKPRSILSRSLLSNIFTTPMRNGWR